MKYCKRWEVSVKGKLSQITLYSCSVFMQHTYCVILCNCSACNMLKMQIPAIKCSALYSVMPWKPYSNNVCHQIAHCEVFFIGKCSLQCFLIEKQCALCSLHLSVHFCSTMDVTGGAGSDISRRKPTDRPNCCHTTLAHNTAHFMICRTVLQCIAVNQLALLFSELHSGLFLHWAALAPRWVKRRIAKRQRTNWSIPSIR